MSCSCGGDNAVRLLVNPVTPLDKLENSLLKGTGLTITPVPVDLYRRYSFVSAYTKLSPASQCVLVDLAVTSSGEGIDNLVSLYYVLGVKYPLITCLLQDIDTDEVIWDAISNSLTEQDLVDLINNSLELED